MASTRQSANTATTIKLRFDDKLTGRGLSSDVLQRKLRTLLDELASITESEAENIDLASFATIRKDLVSPSLILHKDKGVKAYVACCIAELLNVYAPDAPYTAQELKDIFQFFFKQLSNGLKGPDAPYYQLYHDLLASLSRTKSAVLVCDLPQADDMLVEIFKDFFSLATLGLPTPIEAYMSDIMAALLDECQTVPSEVVDILIAQFSAKKSASTNPAFRIAVEVCNASSDKLIRPVCQYFTDTIVQHPYDAHDEEEDEEGGRDFETVKAAHALVKRMHRYAPKLLLSVIPQLQEEMAVDNVQIRLLATQTLGEMLGGQQHGVELMREYRSTWVQWIGRKNDKTPAVRLAFVEAAKKLIAKTEMKEDIDEAMRAKALDPDDKVRAAVCKAYGELDFETSAYYVTKETLQQIASRCLDRKHNVRIEAFDAIGKLYSNAVAEIDNNNGTAIVQFGWIPATVIDASSLSMEVKILAEDVLARYIFPLPSASAKAEVDEDEWTRRFLKTFSNADERHLDSILTLSGLNLSRPTGPLKFIDYCLEYNGGTIDKDEAAVKARFQNATKMIASRFPNPTKVEDDLTAFANHHDRRLYKLLRTCMDLQTDLKTLIKARGDFIKILEKDLPGAMNTMHIFLRKGTLWLINTSSIPTLLNIVAGSSSTSVRSSPSKSPRKSNGTPAKSQPSSQVDSKTLRHAKKVLAYITKHCPQLFYAHLQWLSKEVHANSSPASLEIALRGLASVAALGTDQAPTDNRLESLMTKLALGGDRVNAKFASRYLSNVRGNDRYATNAVEKLYKLLPNADDEHLLAHIAALSEFALYAPDQFEEKSEDIVKFTIHDLIFRVVERDDMETDEPSPQDQTEWCPREELKPLVLAKCQVLRLLTNRCLAHSKGDEAAGTSKPVVKLLLDTLDRDGSFSHYDGDEAERDRLRDDREGGAASRSWIRLKAAMNILRLAQQEAFVPQIIARIPTLALVAQDFCWEVRNHFVIKLTSLLTSSKLPPVFNTIVFLTCHDVEKNIRQRARSYVATQTKRLAPRARLQSFEIIFVRFLHLLAHHPDYDASENDEGLPALAKYIDFYLDLVATSDNVSLLYHLAQHCKTVEDKGGVNYSNNLYLLSELAEYAIKQRAQNYGWTIPIYPNKVNMPTDIFNPLSNQAALKSVRSTVYLTEEMIGWIGDIGKPMKEVQPKAPRKKRARTTTAKTKRPTKRRKKSDSDEEDEIEESDEEEDEGASSTAEPPGPTSDSGLSDEEESGSEAGSKEKLGRGARGKAKAKARHKAKKARKSE